jgi:hypothetical protein
MLFQLRLRFERLAAVRTLRADFDWLIDGVAFS